MQDMKMLDTKIEGMRFCVSFPCVLYCVQKQCNETFHLYGIYRRLEKSYEISINDLFCTEPMILDKITLLFRGTHRFYRFKFRVSAN